MATPWFCRIADDECGPLSWQQLEEFAEKGMITPESPIRKGKDGKWVRAKRVTNLFLSEDDTASGKTAKPSDTAKKVKVAKLLDEPLTPKPPKPPASSAPTVTSVDVSASTSSSKDLFDGVVVTEKMPSVQENGLADLKTKGSKAKAPTQPVGRNAKKSKNKKTVVGLLAVVGVLLVVGVCVALFRSGDSKVLPVKERQANKTKGVIEEEIEVLEDDNLDRRDEPEVVVEKATNVVLKSEPVKPAESEKAKVGGERVVSSSLVVRRGKVDVSLSSVERAMRRFSNRATGMYSKECLQITVKVANNDDAKKINFKSWAGTSRGNKGVVLLDNIKNEYHKVASRGGTTKSIYPGESIEDKMVFELPVKKAKVLELRLPAAAFGGSGVVEFKFPTSKIVEATKKKLVATPKQHQEADSSLPPWRRKQSVDMNSSRRFTSDPPSRRNLEAKPKKSAFKVKHGSSKLFEEPVEEVDPDDPDGDVSDIMADIESLEAEKKPQGAKKDDGGDE